MRIRSIKPEWLEDEKMVVSSPAARALSVALILLADDYGRGRGNPDLVVPRIFPRHSREGREAYRELREMGFTRLYEVRGQIYFEIVNWSKHQKVDKPGNPRVPCRCGISEKNHECPGNFPGSLATDHDHDHDHDQNLDHIPHARARVDGESVGESRGKLCRTGWQLLNSLRAELGLTEIPVTPNNERKPERIADAGLDAAYLERGLRALASQPDQRDRLDGHRCFDPKVLDYAIGKAASAEAHAPTGLSAEERRYLEKGIELDRKRAEDEATAVRPDPAELGAFFAEINAAPKLEDA